MVPNAAVQVAPYWPLAKGVVRYVGDAVAVVVAETRLQCYEGLDISQAVYEWNHARQLLEIRLLEAGHALDRKTAARELFSEEFLIKRPLLCALEQTRLRPPVLLIDEIDRADEEFEGFLLELLSDFQITIPELGPIRAAEPPMVIITSNRTREVHDALKRRCLYFWIDYPTFEKEYRIITTKIPEAPARLAAQVTAFVQELRTADLYKAAGVSESLHWTAALVALNCQELDPAIIDDTLGILLKYREDVQAVRGERVRALLGRALARGRSEWLTGGIGTGRHTVGRPSGEIAGWVRNRERCSATCCTSRGCSAAPGSTRPPGA